MALSEAEVRHVALLARLALTDDEVERLAPQLSDILAYAEQVGEVAAADVPATTHPYPLTNVLRPDEPRPSLPRAAVLAGAPEVEDQRFAVPRIVAVDGGAELPLEDSGGSEHARRSRSDGGAELPLEDSGGSEHARRSRSDGGAELPLEDSGGSEHARRSRSDGGAELPPRTEG